MFVRFADGCAWRGLYIYSGRNTGFNSGTQRFRIVFDPTYRTNRPRLSVAIGWRKDCQGGRKAMWAGYCMIPRWRHWWRFDGRIKGGFLGSFRKVT